MPGNPVHYYSYSFFVAGIYEISEIIWLSVAARWSVIAGHLIAPASVIGIFRNWQQLDMGIAHFFDILDQLVRQFPIGEEAVILLRHPHPASELYLVYVHGRPVGIVFLPLLYPFIVVPVVHAQIIYDGGVLRPCFHIESVGVALVHYVVVIVLYPEFISVVLNNAGNKDFPYTRVAQYPHLRTPAVPVIEGAYNAHAFGVGRPDGEGSALNSVDLHQVRSEFIIYLVVVARSEKIPVIVADGGLEGIYVRRCPLVSVPVCYMEKILEPFVPVVYYRLKKAVVMYSFRLIYLFLIVFVYDAEFFGPGKEGSYGYYLPVVMEHLVHSQYGVRVLMLAVYYKIHLEYAYG